MAGNLKLRSNITGLLPTGRMRVWCDPQLGDEGKV